MLIKCFGTKSFCFYLKLFQSSLLANIKRIFQQTILILIKQKNLLAKNIISRVRKKIFRSISKAIIFILL